MAANTSQRGLTLSIMAGVGLLIALVVIGSVFQNFLTTKVSDDGLISDAQFGGELNNLERFGPGLHTLVFRARTESGQTTLVSREFEIEGESTEELSRGQGNIVSLNRDDSGRVRVVLDNVLVENQRGKNVDDELGGQLVGHLTAGARIVTQATRGIGDFDDILIDDFAFKDPVHVNGRGLTAVGDGWELKDIEVIERVRPLHPGRAVLSAQGTIAVIDPDQEGARKRFVLRDVTVNTQEGNSIRDNAMMILLRDAVEIVDNLPSGEISISRNDLTVGDEVLVFGERIFDGGGGRPNDYRGVTRIERVNNFGDDSGSLSYVVNTLCLNRQVPEVRLEYFARAGVSQGVQYRKVGDVDWIDFPQAVSSGRERGVRNITQFGVAQNSFAEYEMRFLGPEVDRVYRFSVGFAFSSPNTWSPNGDNCRGAVRFGATEKLLVPDPLPVPANLGALSPTVEILRPLVVLHQNEYYLRFSTNEPVNVTQFDIRVKEGFDTQAISYAAMAVDSTLLVEGAPRSFYEPATDHLVWLDSAAGGVFVRASGIEHEFTWLARNDSTREVGQYSYVVP